MRLYRQQLFLGVLLLFLGGLLLHNILAIWNGPASSFRVLQQEPLRYEEYRAQEEDNFPKHTRHILLAVAGNHSGVHGELEVART